jgi:RimJ/RimL family protein N-acetyltransferase
MPIKSDSFIRRADREDLDIVLAWMDDPDFQHFLYGDPARSPRQLRDQIVQMLGRTVGHTVPGGIYLIVDSPEHGPIGLLALQNISWRNRSCGLDLYIGNKQFRSGAVAGIATFRALEYCFDELNLHRVSAYIYSFNNPSWRMLEMTGATRELLLERHVVRDGEYFDLYGYGLLRPEFEVFREKMARLGGHTLDQMVKAIQEREAAETS